MNTSTTPVTELTQAYAAAVHARDVDAFMRLYDGAVRVFDTWDVWQYDGAARWRAAITAWFSSLGTERVQVTFDEMRVAGATDAGGLMLMSAIVTYAALSAEGQALRGMQNRISWALKSEGGALRIVHEHSSTPVNFNDLSAIVQRRADAAGSA